MKASHIAVLGLTAVTSAGVVALMIATFQAPAAVQAKPKVTGSRRPVVIGQALPLRSLASTSLRSSPVESTTPAPADEPDSRALDEFPTITDLDKDHPGIADAYRASRDTMAASSLARKERQCFRRHASDQRLIEWTGLQTFTVDTTGTARLSGLELVPSIPGIQPFLDCISQDQIGQLEFRVPEGTPSTFAVREGGGRIIHSELKPEKVKMEVAALTERLSATMLSPSQRSLLEQQLALWQCYAERGLAARVQCAHDIDGD